MRREDFRYQAFYCEENAWHLAADPRLTAYERWLVFATNRRRACPFWGQRAAPDAGPVMWDYHVFVVARLGDENDEALQVLDLDTTLGFPLPLDAYLAGAFPEVERWSSVHRPFFRVVSAEAALARFASDRRHMRRPGGGWQAPPPPWPPIQGSDRPNGLDRWLDLDAPDPGVVCDVSGLREGRWRHAPTVLHHSRR